MCRIFADTGPPLPESALLLEPSYSLRDQSRNARERTDGPGSGDGWAAGWFAAGVERPGVLKSLLPLGSDLSAPAVFPALLVNTVVGHVRLASPGVQVRFNNTPLDDLDGFIGTVNGGLSPWAGPLGLALRERFDPELEADVQGPTDAEVPGALWRTRQ